MQIILIFPKIPGKTCKGAAQAESLRKGEQPLHETEKKIARLHAHIARQRKDYLHKESRKITNFYDLVCIESLNMKEMSQDSRFGKSVHDNGWGMFTDFLSYKLERAGKKLVRIDKWYPSSKICSCCGKLKKELKLEDRIYSCTCGNQMNRDENAAINICREGLRISGVELDTERKFPDFPQKRRFCSGLRRYETVPLIITEPWDTRG
ncbi:MAG: RNA-guided endonuclease InsQ/TnpB family protein [Clostridium fessum]